MKVGFDVNPQPALEYIEEVKLRAIEGATLGMGEAMDDLGNAAAGNAPKRTGELASIIARSPRVIATQRFIKGTVSANKGGRNVGLWQEFGIHVPAVANKLMVFVAPGGQVVFTRGHKAFHIPGHPFMNPTLQERKARIIETIANGIREAVK
jgi:hypothetical protein